MGGRGGPVTPAAGPMIKVNANKGTLYVLEGGVSLSRVNGSEF